MYLVGVPRNNKNHQQTLENHFQWCEGFKCARVPKNHSNQAKGFAFVHFWTVAQAENAIKQRCNGTLSINGKVLRATFSSIAFTKKTKTSIRYVSIRRLAACHLVHIRPFQMSCVFFIQGTVATESMETFSRTPSFYLWSYEGMEVVL